MPYGISHDRCENCDEKLTNSNTNVIKGLIILNVVPV